MVNTGAGGRRTGGRRTGRLAAAVDDAAALALATAVVTAVAVGLTVAADADCLSREEVAAIDPSSSSPELVPPPPKKVAPAAPAAPNSTTIPATISQVRPLDERCPFNVCETGEAVDAPAAIALGCVCPWVWPVAP